MRIFYPGAGPADAPELRLDQLEAIYRIKREITTGSMGVLVGAGMGSGKTVVSCEVILHTSPARCLIVGVKDAFKQWATQFDDQQDAVAFSAKRKMLRIDNSSVTGKVNMQKLLNGEDGVFYIGLELLRAQDWETVSETYPMSPELKAIFGESIPDETIAETSTVQKHYYAKMKPVDLLISDESHRHSNQQTASIQTMRDIPAKAKIGLSGTFFGNKFENAWPTAVWLWGKVVIGTKGRFELDYCVKIPLVSKAGKQVKTPGGFPLTKITGEKKPGEFVNSLPCYVFIATPIGPPPEPEVVKVALGAEQRRQYDELEAQSLTWIPSSSLTGGRAPLVADLPLVQRIRLRTAALGGMTLVPGASEEDADAIRFDPDCKSTTLNKAYEVLHRPTWEGKKVLILTHSKPFAIEAARRIGLKYKVALKTGDVSSKQWEADKASFMEPVSETSVQYLVAVISAVGTATDGLQANCAKVLWLSEDENNVNNIQGSNRVWRDGVDIANYEAVKIVQTSTIAEGVLAKNRSHKTHLLESVSGIK